MVHGGLSALREVVLWLVWRRRGYRVAGHSMASTLAPGDHGLVDPGAYRAAPPRPGDVVVVRHPYRRDQWLAKRVVAVGPGDRVTLIGDNPGASTDSRTVGAVPAGLVLGRVMSRLACGCPLEAGAARRADC